METAKEFRDYMQAFVCADRKPVINDLDIQVYSRDCLTVTIGYKSDIPSIMFQMNNKKDGFLVYIATVEDKDGPNQNKLHHTWGLNETVSTLRDKCRDCVNIQVITNKLQGFNPNGGDIK